MRETNCVMLTKKNRRDDVACTPEAWRSREMLRAFEEGKKDRARWRGMLFLSTRKGETADSANEKVKRWCGFEERLLAKSQNSLQ